MAKKLVRLHIPSHCKFCNAEATVVVMTTITGGAVRQTWCCRVCGNEWPITSSEAQVTEHRRERPDRRRITRNDRRGK